MYCRGSSRSFFRSLRLCSCSAKIVRLKFKSFSSSRMSNKVGYVPPSIPIFWNLYLKRFLIGSFLKCCRSIITLFLRLSTKQLRMKYSFSSRSVL